MNAVKNVDTRVVVSVVVGLAAFGVLLWGISRLPTNAITSPVKKVAAIVNN